MTDFPTIETERLLLKYVTNDHVNEVFHHFAGDAVNKYVDFEPAENIADAEEIIHWGQNLFKNGKGILWGLFNKADDAFMGQINYVNKASANFTGDTHRAEIGFDLSPRFWGNGYMTEAMKRTISYIFNDYQPNIKRIEAIINTRNHRAEKLVKQIGFKKDGVLRGYVEWKTELWDMSIFSLLKTEWQPDNRDYSKP